MNRKVIPFPSPRPSPYRCEICGFPSISKQGISMHYNFCHTDKGLGERNWCISYMILEERRPISEVATLFNLDESRVYHIFQRALDYPKIYDLDPNWRSEAK